MLVKFVEMIVIIGSLNTTISKRDNYTSEHVHFVWRIFMPYKQKITNVSIHPWNSYQN